MRQELIEIDIGLFSGLRWNEVEERHPHEQRSFFRYWWDGVPGAESSDSLYSRGEAVWRLLFGYCQQGDRNILVVTHSGLLQWIIKSTLDNRRWFPILPMGNCCIYKLTVNNQLVPPSAQVAETTPYHTWRWELMGHRVTDG
jgi:broad specificity phosphatase PhoE